MRRYAIHLFLAMSMEDAKEVLGLPKGRIPTPAEIQKAYKQKALENHPDRGGNHQKMVEVNVAKEILEGGRPNDRTPFKKDPVDPAAAQEAARQEFLERRRNQALTVIDQVSKDISTAIEAAISATTLAQWRIPIREFFAEDLEAALDKIQDQIEASPQKENRDWKRADALCQSILNKARRLGKKYLALTKLQGELTAGLLGMGSESVSYNKIAGLYAETANFGMGWRALYQESGNLMSLIGTSEDVPYEWDNVYHRSHQVIISFKEDYDRIGDTLLKSLKGRLESGLSRIGDVVLDVAPEAWKKADIDWEYWRYPGDFEWARKVVQDSAKKKNASVASRVASKYRVTGVSEE